MFRANSVWNTLFYGAYCGCSCRCYYRVFVIQVLALFYTGHAQVFFSDSVLPSGAHITAPRFVNYNLTWRMSFAVSSESSTMAFALFENRSLGGIVSGLRVPGTIEPPPDCVGNLVSICCLHEFAGRYTNAELRAYTAFIGPCGAVMQSAPATVTLSERPAPSAGLVHVFDAGQATAIRMWTVFEDTVTNPFTWSSSTDVEAEVEIPAEELAAPWLSRELGASKVTAGVTDREVVVRFLFVRAVDGAGALVSIALQSQTLVFHDATRLLDQPPVQSQPLVDQCAGRPHPPNSRWIARPAGAAAANLDSGVCVWFCRPGFFRLPSSTAWWYANSNEGVCRAEPVFTAIVSLALAVDMAPPGGALPEPVVARLVMDVRAALARCLHADRAVRDGNDTLVFVPGPPLANGTLFVEFLAFTGLVEPNASAQEQAVVASVHRCANSTYPLAYSFEAAEAMGMLPAAPGAAAEAVQVVDVRVLASNATLRRPVYRERVPALFWTVAWVWGSFVLLLCAMGTASALFRRRHRSLRSLARSEPLLAPGFDIPRNLKGRTDRRFHI